MRVSLNDVRRVASLSMLTFDEAGERSIQKDLEAVLEHVQRLNVLDTSGVEPTSYILKQRNVMRPDEPGPKWPRSEMLANAPDAEDGFFSVPRVVE